MTFILPQLAANFVVINTYRSHTLQILQHLPAADTRMFKFIISATVNHSCVSIICRVRVQQHVADGWIHF